MTPTNRLEQMIRRLTSQRNCLAFAAEMVVDLPGPVLEFGLGKGRTYDFMRARLPEREIYVFERDVHCRPEYVPADGYLLLGDVRDTVPAALAQIGEPAALAHFDIGTHDFAADAPLTDWLTLAVTPLIRTGGAWSRTAPWRTHAGSRCLCHRTTATATTWSIGSGPSDRNNTKDR